MMIFFLLFLHKIYMNFTMVPWSKYHTTTEESIFLT